ncbi:hypothetical protein C8R44DRAFT_752574 [Mycena epipterygia]|nr:hypothetical protein C8R44DRAFT_752574 [Mycena epipterygia]
MFLQNVSRSKPFESGQPAFLFLQTMLRLALRKCLVTWAVEEHHMTASIHVESARSVAGIVDTVFNSGSVHTVHLMHGTHAQWTAHQQRLQNIAAKCGTPCVAPSRTLCRSAIYPDDDVSTKEKSSLHAVGFCSCRSVIPVIKQYIYHACAHIRQNDELSRFSIKLTNFLIPKRSNEVTKTIQMQQEDQSAEFTEYRSISPMPIFSSALGPIAESAVYPYLPTPAAPAMGHSPAPPRAYLPCRVVFTPTHPGAHRHRPRAAHGVLLRPGPACARGGEPQPAAGGERGACGADAGDADSSSAGADARGGAHYGPTHTASNIGVIRFSERQAPGTVDHAVQCQMSVKWKLTIQYDIELSACKVLADANRIK